MTSITWAARPVTGFLRRLSARERRDLGLMGAAILFLHVSGFGLLAFAVASHQHLGARSTFGIGTGILAYTLGLRHAFDADHIAAIDNTTRKLMAEGERPTGVGFFFSLGHSSVVFVVALLLNFGVRAFDGQLRRPGSALHQLTGVIGTSISGGFLMLIAALNVVVLISICRVFVAMRKGRFDDEELERQLAARGLFMRFFGPLARSVDKSWKMYPIGLLFGLGFDTATEVALLVLAGTAVTGGLPLYAILALPLLFAAGMSLLDTIDGSFMNFAYGWAFANPVRKVYYNITITGLSVAVALFIGGLEIAQVLASQFHLSGGMWNYAAAFNINKSGFVIAGMFVVVWFVSLVIWRWGRVERRWTQAAERARAALD